MLAQKEKEIEQKNNYQLELTKNIQTTNAKLQKITEEGTLSEPFKKEFRALFKHTE
jgi:hypothetical protein